MMPLIIKGTQQRDWIFPPATIQPQLVFTFGGNDTVGDSFYATDDFIFTGNGHDNITLHGGDDFVDAGRGRDSITITECGNVKIDGGKGFDTVIIEGNGDPSTVETHDVERVLWLP